MCKNRAFNIKIFGKCYHCPEGLVVVEEFNLSRLRHLDGEKLGVVAYIGDVLCLFGRSVVIGRSGVFVLDLSMMKTTFHKCTPSKHAGREGESMSSFCLELGEIRRRAVSSTYTRVLLGE